MSLEDEIKLRFEMFVWHEHNTQGEDIERLKRANIYFVDEKTGLKKTAEMIITIQRHMIKGLPPTSHENHNLQFSRMNDIIRECKRLLIEISSACEALTI